VIGYVRCSTREQATDGYSLAAQRDRIQREADHRGWTITHWVEDPGVSGAKMDRPGLDYALALLQDGRASGLVVSKLDRLGRTVVGLADLLKHADKYGWNLVALDVGIDSTNYTGRMVLHVLAAVAEWERDRIGERTSEGMAQARLLGNIPGRPRATPATLAARIVRERTEGKTYTSIAAGLNDDGHRTSRGKNWLPGTVRMVLEQEGAV
jgi:DNA invertase Pin-like site-specific DNA recombinase